MLLRSTSAECEARGEARGRGLLLHSFAKLHAKQGDGGTASLRKADTPVPAASLSFATETVIRTAYAVPCQAGEATPLSPCFYDFNALKNSLSFHLLENPQSL